MENDDATATGPAAAGDSDPSAKASQSPNSTGSAAIVPQVVVVPDAVIEARETLLAIHQWIDRSDTKAAVIMSAIAAAVAVEGAGVVNLLSHGHHLRVNVLWFMLGSMAFLLVSAFLAGLSLYPQLADTQLGREYAGHQEGGPFTPGELVYFGLLRTMSPAEIERGLKLAARDGSLVAHLAEQIHRNAAIVWNKHRKLQLALRCLIPAAALAAIGFAFWVGDFLAARSS